MNNTRSVVLLAALLTFSLSASSCALTKASVHEVETYHRYLSDVLLVESHQILDPDRAFTYDSSGNGELLKSVLDRKRFEAALTIYGKRLADGEEEENLSTFLRPLMREYAKAFSRFGVRYENEFLDTVQIGVMLLTSTAFSTEADANTGSPKDASDADDAKDIDAFKELNLNIRMMFSRQLQELVARKKFTLPGERRALAMIRELVQKEHEEMNRDDPALQSP